MGELRVDFAALSELASSVSQRIDDVEELLSEVNGQVNQLTELWEGSAGDGLTTTQLANVLQSGSL
ncbi:MAG TPA: WXG100 family type VII secretion target [Pseudonocardiaceae bacterium]